MKLVKATTEAEIQLQGITISLQQVDGKIEAVVITDNTGKFVRIVKDGEYTPNLKVLIAEPKKYKTVYKLIVKIEDGVSVFKLKDKTSLDDKIFALRLTEDDYTVEEVQVEVEKSLQGCEVDINIDDVPF